MLISEHSGTYVDKIMFQLI